ncbi:MAG TPA: hypothetical protein PLB89_05305 [Flavobacteriales bacterium]|nr:hypothetical protein [Flavobacteriales bacterium]
MIPDPNKPLPRLADPPDELQRNIDLLIHRPWATPALWNVFVRKLAAHGLMVAVRATGTESVASKVMRRV